MGWGKKLEVPALTGFRVSSLKHAVASQMTRRKDCGVVRLLEARAKSSRRMGDAGMRVFKKERTNQMAFGVCLRS